MGDARVIFFLLGRSAGARGQTRLLLPSQALRYSPHPFPGLKLPESACIFPAAVLQSV